MTEQQKIKEEALRKMDAAWNALRSAQNDLSVLEGEGYCEVYESIANNYVALQDLTNKLRSLDTPTEVWRG